MAKKTSNLLMMLVLFIVCGAFASANMYMSDQGTGVIDKSTGLPLSSADLTVQVWDDPTAGSLLYSYTFTGVINNGSWNLIIGELPGPNLTLSYGQVYYKDYLINGEDATFKDNSGASIARLKFTSPNGQISSAFVSETDPLFTAWNYDYNSILGRPTDLANFSNNAGYIAISGCNAGEVPQYTGAYWTCAVVNGTGSQGPQGPPGANGSQGIQGPPGNDGADGVNGADGYTPIYGVDYRNGTDGAQGIQGPPGPAGANGTNGVDGINGTNGLNGQDGINGTNGINGIDGVNGTNGINGIDGINGTNGINGVNGTSVTIDSISDLGGGVFVWRFSTGFNFTTSNLTGPIGPQGISGIDGVDINSSNFYNKTESDIRYLSARLRLYFYATPSSVNSSYTLMNATVNPTLQGTTFSSMPIGENALAARLYDYNLSVIPAGAYTQHTSANYSSGAPGKVIRFHSELYIRNITGGERLIGSSVPSDAMVTVAGTWQDLDWSGTITSAQTLLPGEYLVMRLNATVSGGGGAPTIILYVGGQTGASLTIGVDPVDLVGVQGPQGVPGINGTNGIDGINGTNGIDGVNGTNGINGLDGINGTNGINGVNGTSVTIDAIDDNFDGTFVWRFSTGFNFTTSNLTGPQGIQGIQGLPGIDGVNGTNGIFTGGEINSTINYTNTGVIAVFANGCSQIANETGIYFVC